MRRGPFGSEADDIGGNAIPHAFGAGKPVVHVTHYSHDRIPYVSGNWIQPPMAPAAAQFVSLHHIAIDLVKRSPGGTMSGRSVNESGGPLCGSTHVAWAGWS